MPLVAVPADIRELQGYSWHATPSQYLEALRDAARLMPIVVPAFGEDALRALDAVDGVLISGSRTNVHPSHYDVSPTEGHEPFDPDRDATTLPIIREAVRRGLPILAICRGIQELNVAFGGSLATEIQEIEGRDDHRMTPSTDPDIRFQIRHPIAIEQDGPVGAILGGCARVNSLHRQAIDRLADGLTVEARAPDGTIEAVSVKDAKAFAVGVQWHPEYWARGAAGSRDEASWTLFAAFGDAVRGHAARRTATAA